MVTESFQSPRKVGMSHLLKSHWQGLSN
jgi:hypothetical protein